MAILHYPRLSENAVQVAHDMMRRVIILADEGPGAFEDFRTAVSAVKCKLDEAVGLMEREPVHGGPPFPFAEWNCACGTRNLCREPLCHHCRGSRPPVPIDEKAVEQAQYEEFRVKHKFHPIPADQLEIVDHD